MIRKGPGESNRSRHPAMVVVCTAILALAVRATSAQDVPIPSPSAQTGAPGSEVKAPATPEKVEVQPLVHDNEIAARLSSILRSTNWFGSIEVTVENGVVFLDGSTSKQEYRDWAAALAQKTQDVAAVVNRIEVLEGPYFDISPAIRQLQDMGRWVVQTSPLFAVGLVVFIFAYFGSRLTARFARHIMTRRGVNELLREVLAKCAAIPVFLLGLYVLLQVSGLSRLAMTILGGTGIAGLILGIAFRDITENFLASLLISVQNPFRGGDVIRIGEYKGVVQKVSIRGTLLLGFDGTYIQIPNSMVYKSVILNYTANELARQQVPLRLRPDASVVRAQEVTLAALKEHPAVLITPEPMVLVERLNRSSIDLRIYFWINVKQHSGDKVLSSVIRSLKCALDEAGLSLPVPRYEVAFTRIPSAERPAGAAKKKHKPKSATGTDAPVATAAEDNLASETDSLAEQAKRSREPEAGVNLLASDSPPASTPPEVPGSA